MMRWLLSLMLLVGMAHGQGLRPFGVKPAAGGGSSVAFDAKISGGNGGSGDTEQATSVTTLSTTHLTLGGTATCLVAIACMQGGSTLSSFSATWNSVAMTAGPVGANVTGPNIYAVTFYLTNPATGNHTLALSWTNSADIYLGAVSFSGANGTACVNTGDNVSTSVGTPTSVTVTSNSSGATVANYCGNAAAPTQNFNQVFSDQALAPGGGGSYQIGGTSNAHSFTGSGATIVATAGLHVTN